MLGFRALLIALFVGLTAYTVPVVSAHGVDFVSVAIADVAALGWAGQFHLDFTIYLVLSALWIAWRHRFSAAGLGLAALAAVGGAMFFVPYLLLASARAGGDVRALVLGPERAAG